MNPFSQLFLVFALIPIAEIVVLIKVGSIIGALPTVALVILTAITGAALMRYQGMQTMSAVRQAMGRGEIPAVQMLEGMGLLLGGALLLTPGFITDAFGFALLVPPLRRRLARHMLSRMEVRQTGGRPDPGARNHYTIEGEFRHRDH
ncbi:MAG TPA: FxsA family protein [Gammaproteobacteria bacterium]|nr:FxsA family protein [Gammaproteobacteria bacterium]